MKEQNKKPYQAVRLAMQQFEEQDVVRTSEIGVKFDWDMDMYDNPFHENRVNE